MEDSHPTCNGPLLSLKLLQVWGNIQPYDDPSRMMFDLSNRKHWSPLYSDRHEPPASVQQDLHYSETDDGSVMELQER